MLASDAPVLVGSLVVVAVVALTVAAAVGMAWRGARRQLRALHGHPTVRSAVALWSLARPGALSASSIAGSVSTARLRHELWRGVGSAERSVRHARAAAGAVGELPSLCRRLHEVAADLDRLLVIGDGLGPGLPELQAARHQAAEVLEAARRIRLAAMAAAGDATLTRVRSLTDDADREVQSLAAGIARARDAFPPVA